MPDRHDRPVIERLTIQNYRVLRDVTFDHLTPLTVLFGPSGSGKSTVFDVFAFLDEAFTTNLRRAWDRRNRMHEVRSRGSDGPVVFELKYGEGRKGTPNGKLGTYRLAIEEYKGSPIVAEETLRWSTAPGSGGSRDILGFARGAGASFEIRVFRRKHDLLKKLPQRLAGYASWIDGADHRLVVLVDRDDEECVELRARLDRIAAQAGLTATGTNRLVPDRLAIEELEAWFPGDLGAVAAAFPRVPTSTASQTPSRDPDAIRGGTAAALERLLAEHGYHKAGLAKIAAATAIAAHTEVDHNRSRSFQVLRDGLRSLVGTGAS